MRMEISQNEKDNVTFKAEGHVSSPNVPPLPQPVAELKWIGWAAADTLRLQLCELKINQFPANKALVPYHLSAAGWEINEGGIVTRVSPLTNRYHFMGLLASCWAKPLKLNLATSLTSAAGLFPVALLSLQEAYFQVLGPTVYGQVDFLIKKKFKSQMTLCRMWKCGFFFLIFNNLLFNMMVGEN